MPELRCDRCTGGSVCLYVGRLRGALGALTLTPLLSYHHDTILRSLTVSANPIVLTAWRRIARLGSFDDARIRRFIEAYEGIDHHEESATGPRITDVFP